MSKTASSSPTAPTYADLVTTGGLRRRETVQQAVERCTAAVAARDECKRVRDETERLAEQASDPIERRAAQRGRVSTREALGRAEDEVVLARRALEAVLLPDFEICAPVLQAEHDSRVEALAAGLRDVLRLAMAVHEVERLASEYALPGSSYGGGRCPVNSHPGALVCSSVGSWLGMPVFTR